MAPADQERRHPRAGEYGKVARGFLTKSSGVTESPLDAYATVNSMRSRHSRRTVFWRSSPLDAPSATMGPA